MKKKPSHPMLRKYTVTIEEQIVQEFPVEAYDLSHALETASETTLPLCCPLCL